MIYAKPRCTWRARHIAWCRKYGKFCDAPREYEYCLGYEPIERHHETPFVKVSRNITFLRKQIFGPGRVYSQQTEYPSDIMEATKRFMVAFARARGLLPRDPSASREEIRKAIKEMEIIRQVLPPEDFQHVKTMLSEIEDFLGKHEIESAIAKMEALWTWMMMKAFPPPPYIASPFTVEQAFPETLRLLPLFDMQDTLIEHKFPHEKAAVIDTIISLPGDIYREMTHAYPHYTYVGEKWEKLTTYSARPPLSWLQAGDWEEIRNQLQDPSYKTLRDRYLSNLQQLREETVKMPMDPKRQAVMIESLDMIKALILWFESQDPYAPPRQQLDKLTDAVASYFPREFFEGSRVQTPLGSPIHTYKFLIRTFTGEEVAYEQGAKDSTEALELLAERLDTTPATLFSVTVEVLEDAKCIWIAKPTPRPADFLFPEYIERKRKGLCPFCGRKIDCAEFRDEVSRREYRISGLCQKCQDEVFRRSGVQIPPRMDMLYRCVIHPSYSGKYNTTMSTMSQTLELKNRHASELRGLIAEAENQKREVGVMLCKTPTGDLHLSRACWGRCGTVTVADCHDGLSPLGSFHVHLGGTSVFSPTDLELAIRKEQLSCLGYSRAGVPTLKCITPKRYYDYPYKTREEIKRDLDQASQDIDRAVQLYRSSPTNPEAISLSQRAQATLRNVEQVLDAQEVTL